jgi:hypothetical protein
MRLHNHVVLKLVLSLPIGKVLTVFLHIQMPFPELESHAMSQLPVYKLLPCRHATDVSESGHGAHTFSAKATSHGIQNYEGHLDKWRALRKLENKKHLTAQCLKRKDKNRRPLSSCDAVQSCQVQGQLNHNSLDLAFLSLSCLS